VDKQQKEKREINIWLILIVRKQKKLHLKFSAHESSDDDASAEWIFFEFLIFNSTDLAKLLPANFKKQ